jgi:polygalacturonase
MGTEFMVDEEPSHYNYKIENGIDMRPHLLTLYGCTNVVIRDVTFCNAAYWCLHPVGCQDVLIQGIRILNNLKVRNCDGIDPDHSRNVRISDCYIESADDCICLKTRREFDEYGPTENVTVTGCTLISTSCAIKLGSENTQGIRNAVFNSIVITRTNRAIGIQNRDEGAIENIIFSNIVADCRLFHDVWWGKSEPIYITAFNRHETESHRFPPDGVRRSAGPVRDIQFNHIQCRSENGIYVSGSTDTRPSRLQFNHVRIEIDKKTDYPGGVHDRRPCDVEGIIESGTSGFHFDSCDDILLTNCCVSWGSRTPDYYKHALFAENTTELVNHEFRGAAAGEGIEAQVILSGKNG